VSQTLEILGQSIEALDASLERLKQLRLAALEAGQDAADIDLARQEALAERHRLGSIQAHLEAAAVAVELDSVQLRELDSAARALADLVRANALVEGALDTVSDALAAARRVGNVFEPASQGV
jgi:hypothetical protein